MRNGFGKACEDAKVTNFHFHDLRHTFASRLADTGVDAFTIAELLGHSTLEMTRRYTHATDERKRKAVAALGQKSKGGKVVAIWSQKQKRQAIRPAAFARNAGDFDDLQSPPGTGSQVFETGALNHYATSLQGKR